MSYQTCQCQHIPFSLLQCTCACDPSLEYYHCPAARSTSVLVYIYIICFMGIISHRLGPALHVFYKVIFFVLCIAMVTVKFVLHTDTPVIHKQEDRMICSLPNLNAPQMESHCTGSGMTKERTTLSEQSGKLGNWHHRDHLVHEIQGQPLRKARHLYVHTNL